MDPPTLIKTILEALPFLKKLQKALKKKTKAVIFPQDQQAVRKLIIQLEELSNSFENIPAGQLEEIEREAPDVAEARKIIRELCTDYIPIWIDERYAIISKEAQLENILKKYRESREKAGVEGDLIPASQAEYFISFRETPKPILKPLVEIINKLDLDLRSLVHLSADMERLYKNGLIDKAEELKMRVRVRFDEFGVKFCNLYQRYLKRLFLSLADKPANVLNAEVRQFTEKEAKNIFFIYRRMKAGEIHDTFELLKEAFELQTEYVAIHSLGRATMIAKAIVSGIEEPEGYEIVIIDTKKEFSKIWYKEKGEWIFKLMSGMG